MLSHCRWRVWEGYSHGYLQHVEDYSIINKFLVYLFSIFRFGHESVIVFFVLSGFVVHLKLARKIKEQKLVSIRDYFDYLKRRIKRIYPPLIIAILLTYILDSIGKSQAYEIYFSKTLYQSLNSNTGSDLSLRTLVGNLLCLMRTYVPVFGSNGPLWSLKYEWWFYMFYPVFWVMLIKSSLLSLVSIFTLFLLSIFGFLDFFLLFKDVFTYMIVWWLGVLVADFYTKRISLQFLLLSFTLYSLIGVISLKNNQFIYDYFLGLGISVVLTLLLYLNEKGYRLNFLVKLKPLGDMSYTLYLIHSPILVLISGYIMSKNKGYLPRHFGYFVTASVFILVVSYLLHFILEKTFGSRKTEQLG